MPRSRLALLTAFLGAACALLSACGGGSDGGSGAGSTSSAAGGGSESPAANAGDSNGNAPDPCSLITAAALSSAYGVTFGEGKADDTGVAGQRGFKACKFEDSTGTKSFLLQTVASGGPLGQTVSALFDQSKAIYPGATDGGVGDKSILLPDDGGFLAVKGDVFVQGNAIIFGANKPAGATKTVLQEVVGKLG